MTARESSGKQGTPARILDSAERLTQVRGFNGFSYADIAEELGMTKASLHYHYPGKAELGQELISRYTERFDAALAAIDTRLSDAPAKLHGFTELYADVLRGRRMCLCGMLAAEYDTLPKAMQDAVLRFFDASERWLAKVLRAGQEQGTLSLRASADDTAGMFLSALEGAMLIARSYREVSRFETAAAQLVAGLLAGPTPPGS
jgi:TetR/AcrR family transcriptional regulator, transcriptional repressor for nem operon